MGNRGVLRLAIFVLFWVMAHPPSLVSAALTLESSFNVTQTYTDNLFYDDKDREDDFGTLLGPNFELKYANPDIVIGGTYFGRFVAYVNNPDQNRYIQNANIILGLPFLTKQYKNLTVTIDESMNFTPQLDAFSLSGAQDASTTSPVQSGAGGGSQVSSSTQGVGGTQGVFTSRASSFLNRAGITLGYAWSPRLTPTLAYTNQYRHFFSGGLQDSLAHTGSFSVPYEMTNATIGPLYSYRQTDFLGKSTEGTSADKIISHNIQLQISYNFTPSLTGSIRGGTAFTKQKDAEEFEGGTTDNLSNKWQTNPIGGATLTKTYRNGSISLNAISTIGSGGGLASQAARTRSITGRIQHALSLKMNAFASFGYAQNKSTGDGDALDTNTYRIQSGVGYAFLPWLSGNLIYSHINQRSKGSAAGDVQVNEVFLGLTAIADPWVLIR